MQDKEYKQYDEVYKFGNTTVCIVAPKIKTKNEIERILEDFYKVSSEICCDTLREK